MIEYLKGHPQVRQQADNLPKKLIHKSTEEDTSLESAIQKMILERIKRENYSSDKEYLDALEAVRSNI